MRGSDKKAEGTTDEIKGKLQHAHGELTDDDDKKAKGRATKTKGKTKKAAGQVQNAVDALKS